MIDYTLVNREGMPLPTLKGSMALTKAGERDLRVLICISQAEPVDDIDRIALWCDCTREEVIESANFWCRYGVLKEGRDAEGADALPNMPVSDEKLAEVLRICTLALGKADVNFSEYEIDSIKNMLGSYDSDFIICLVKYYCGERKKTFEYIRKVASSLVDKGICTAEDFVLFTEVKDTLSFEARRLFGLGTTAFSKSQSEYIDKWSAEYGYGKDVFGMAYDIMADRAARRSFGYIDKILTSWYSGGCRTPDDVKKYIEKENAERASAQKKGVKKEKMKLKNDSFDTVDAFNRALARSVAIMEKEKGD